MESIITAKTEEYRKYNSERVRGAGNPRYGKPGTFLGKKHTEDTLRLVSMLRDYSR